MEVSTSEEIDPNDPSIKSMKEVARQLVLTFEIEE